MHVHVHAHTCTRGGGSNVERAGSQGAKGNSLSHTASRLAAGLIISDPQLETAGWLGGWAGGCVAGGRHVSRVCAASVHFSLPNTNQTLLAATLKP